VLVFCPRCSSALPDWYFKQARTDSSCPSCYAKLSVEIFPAVFRQRAKIDLASLTSAEGEACCYEHTTKRAKAVCHQCGRFLCALCEVDIDGKIWCPGCLHPTRSGPKLQALERQRTLYDSIALALATLPALFFVYPSVISAPVVLFLTARHWKSPSSIVPRNKWRFIAAIILVLAELALVAAVIVFALRVPQARVRHK